MYVMKLRTFRPGKQNGRSMKRSQKPQELVSSSVLPALAVFGALYVILAAVIKRWPSTRTDVHVTRTLQSKHHPVLESFMTFVSWFGFRPQSLLLPLSVVYAFWRSGRRLESVLLIAAWFSSMMSFLTKQVIRRPRPDASVVRVVVAKTRDSSFPSGHVVHYVTFWGMVAYLLAFRSPWRGFRWIAGAVMAPIIALVGPSRIYLGHHWFTDVLGSYLLGTAYLSGLIEIHSRLGVNQNTEPDGWMSGASHWLR
ncbi:MAG: phosphatase PAP2 family protein [Sphaerobacteraceae bacterium]|nr:MAG: phosphatase PAP2 family protein [Sphaerobacteraceae bacterium]